jgi:hypothetical protein
MFIHRRREMQAIKSTGLPVVLLFVSAMLGGCMGTGSEGTAEPASGPASASTAVTDDQPATDSAASDLIAPATSGCNHVVFCDQPNSSNGTVCHQDGCSLGAAETECLDDLNFLGCSLHCPAIMQTSSGNVVFRLSCAGNGSCCPANTQYCGPRGACCDGIHFNSACPPL